MLSGAKIELICQPRSQGLFPSLGAGREKTLAREKTLGMRLIICCTFYRVVGWFRKYINEQLRKNVTQKYIYCKSVWCSFIVVAVLKKPFMIKRSLSR